MKTLLTALTMIAASTAAAEGYRPVTDRSEFMALIGDRKLSNRLYGITLSVTPDGAIAGTGAGWEITGNWEWQKNYFCREMSWGGDPIPYNCQLVEVRNGNEMRFTVDKGAGDNASFMLR